MFRLLLAVKNVGSGGRAVERRTVNRGDGGSIPPNAVSKLRGNFITPHLPMSSGRVAQSLVSGAYTRGSKDPTRDK